MPVHTLHSILIGLPLLFYFAISLKKSSMSRISRIALLVLVVFVTIHTTTSKLIVAHNHGSSGSTEHPCCMPEVATPFLFKSILVLQVVLSRTIDISLPSNPTTIVLSPTGRSPPIIFSV